jgi:glyceraldehyde 3-phosphate dehydrogenase
MSVRVAINGFWDVLGRLAFRQMFWSRRDMRIVAINDLTSPDMLAYLLKYDFISGAVTRLEVHGLRLRSAKGDSEGSHYR